MTKTTNEDQARLGPRAAHRRLAALALVVGALSLAGCATMQGTTPVPSAQPGLTAGPAQCLGMQAATTAWAVVAPYVEQMLEQQRLLACLPPAQLPTAPTASTTPPTESTAQPSGEAPPAFR